MPRREEVIVAELWLNKTGSLAVLLVLGTVGGCDASFVDQRPGEGQAVDGGGLDLATATEAGRADGGSAADLGDATPGADAVPGADAAAMVDAGADPVVFARGDFAGRSGYQGAGRAELVRRGDVIELRFSDDFATSAVPGPVVVLSNRAEMGSAIRTDQGDVELGVLQATSGAQTYAVPDGDGGRRYAWVYCKPFGVEVARAMMEDL
jgi:hypothetical protein